MDRERFYTDRWRHRAQTWAYMGGSALLLLVAASIVFGLTGAVWLLAVSAAILSLRDQIPLQTILRIRGASPVSPFEAPALHGIVAELAARANLLQVPALYYVPSRRPEAFTVAAGDVSAIALSQGLVDLLDRDELTAVLAHEVSHVRAGDTSVLTFMHSLRQFTSTIALFGLAIAGFGFIGLLPPVSPLAPLLLVIPGASMAMAMAVSRTREFDADMGAAGLVGDPRSLARALWKLDRVERGPLGGLGVPLESMIPRSLRTHPPTRERVERLLALVPRFRHLASRVPLPGSLAGRYYRATGSSRRLGYSAKNDRRPLPEYLNDPSPYRRPRRWSSTAHRG